MINDLRGEVQAELKLIRDDASYLRNNTRKVLQRTLFWLDSIENTMLSPVASEDVALLQTNFNVISEGRNAISNQMKFLFSRVADRLTIVSRSLCLP